MLQGARYAPGRGQSVRAGSGSTRWHRHSLAVPFSNLRSTRRLRHWRRVDAQSEQGPVHVSRESAMVKTMKAAVVREFKKPLSIDEIPVPEVGPGQILVKI